MSITIEDISSILKHHQNDAQKLKSLEIFLKCGQIQVCSIEILNKLTEPFENKTEVFNFLYSSNALADINTEHSQFFGFLTDSKILNDKAEMNELKRMLRISPDMIVDVLNFIRGTGKSDAQKLELVKEVVGISDLFSKLVESIGKDDVAKLLSVYFVSYESYVACCQLLHIEQTYYENYRDVIALDNDTMTFFGDQKMLYSKMSRGKWYSFEKELSDGTVLIYNIKKTADSKKHCNDPAANVELKIEKNIVNLTRTAYVSSTEWKIIYSGKGYIINEHSTFKEAK